MKMCSIIRVLVPYDRVITPYFHSGPQGNAMPTSMVSALVGAQTGLMVIAQETFI